MSTAYNMWFIYAILCASHLVQSARVRTTFGYYDNNYERVGYVSEVISPRSFDDNFGNKLTLHKLMNENNLPTLTVQNISFITYLLIENIFLETIPYFINV